ncbi:MAG: adenylate/guanylate cyclase domain-containing protein [Pseudomonadota bacterium]
MDIPDQSTSSLSRSRSVYVAKLRIVSGLILFIFAITHFINHSFGLVSVEAMQWGMGIRGRVMHTNWGPLLLLAAAAVHFVLGISKFIGTRTWRLRKQDIVQLTFGLLIPVFLIGHVLETRGAFEMFGTRVNYPYVLWMVWPDKALSQGILMMLVWVHGCIGIHHWLIVRSWYRKYLWVWNSIAVAVPALAYAGFVAAARVSALEPRENYNPISAENLAKLDASLWTANLTYYAVLGTAFAVWIALLIRQRFSKRIVVTYANQRAVPATHGSSVLDISRMNRIPHASVCGGRARCSTCRVRVVEGQETLPPPAEIETRVLKRIAAPANVRLACQLRPTQDLTISPLMPGNVDASRGGAVDRYHWGVEQDATILFCDLRGFTKMSEGRLSYDVVFLLNQFLGQMAVAIQDKGGFVDKFMGDGIMAIFGMEGSVQDGALRAIDAAKAMGGVLDALNQSLREELPAPLQIGVGLNTGPVVLGRIGAGDRTGAAARITALGETVNTASRLEGLTKSLEVQIIVAHTTIEAAGLPPSAAMERQDVEVRGMRQPVAVYAVKHASDLPVLSGG